MATYGVLAAGGLLGGAYLMGKLGHNDHLSETAWEAGEAAVSSLVPALVIKTVTRRARPPDAQNTGFWQGGNSFPSEHAAAAWSIASVVAHEYPGIGTQLLAYGAASAMSASRVLGRKHFTSDVMIGSALGWWFGRQVYRSHREPEQDRALWGKFVRADHEISRDPASMGSPYVPLDSWIYRAFDRLAAMGYAPTAFEGLRPWTRMECARLLGEIEDTYGYDSANSVTAATIRSLRSEFADELGLRGGSHNLAFRVESLYTRTTFISGQPLRDGYHFGQTIVNDYGRPYAEGTNAIAGISLRATAGPLAIYARGEYQHAPAAAPYSDSVRELIAQIDRSPVPPGTAREQNLFRPIELYAAFRVGALQMTFGKQALWWGPGKSGPWLFSNNAEPIPMLRIAQAEPVKLPSILGWLGPVRTEFFVGQLAGHSLAYSDQNQLLGSFDQPLSPQPYVHGQKFSFKPTRNLEFSVSRTTIFGGEGFPLTAQRIITTLFSTRSLPGNRDPGDRRSAVDLTYRLPKLRNWATFYLDAFTEDEPSPIGYPRRAAMNPGIYVSHLPKIPKLDFRAEGMYTNLPAGTLFPGFHYYNVRYLQGYTNRGQLLGNWIGRDGTGVQMWSTYSFTPRNSVEVSFRNAKISREFIPGGGTINDGTVRGNWFLRSDLSVSSLLQYERWAFPVLAATQQTDIAASVQLTFWPGHRNQP